jgi:hypothetical protein
VQKIVHGTTGTGFYGQHISCLENSFKNNLIFALIIFFSRADFFKQMYTFNALSNAHKPIINNLALKLARKQRSRLRGIQK